jgi:hypothetical protein
MFPLFRLSNLVTKKINKIKHIMVLDSPQITNQHNNQPKTCGRDGGGIGTDAQPDGDVRGVQLNQFCGNQVGVL